MTSSSSNTQTGSSTEKNLLQGTSSPSSTPKRSSTEQTQLPGTSSSYNYTQTGLSHPTTRSILLGDFYHPNIKDAISIQLSPEDLDFLTKIPKRKFKKESPDPLVGLAPTKETSGFICSEANPLEFHGVAASNQKARKETPTTQPLQVTFTQNTRTWLTFQTIIKI